MKKQLCLFIPMMLISGFALATAPAGAALDWEPGLALLVTSITGPFAFTASIVGMAVAGGTLIFGSDLNAFGRTMIYMILVIGFLVAAANTMQILFNVGATFSYSSTTMIAMAIALLLALSIALAGIQQGILKLFSKSEAKAAIPA